MADIKASDVKALREKTGAGMMECKNALVETNGDFAAAEKLLKEKGLAALEKRAGRATNEGKIFVKKDGDGGPGSNAVLVEMASETDFVARNPEFIALGQMIVDEALAKKHEEPTAALHDKVAELATKIRENMSLKRLKAVHAGSNEILSTYIHGDGAIGVVVKMSADKAEALANEEVKALCFSLALHVAAFNPMYLDRGKVDAGWLAEQEDIFRKQMEQDESMQGKPANVVDNILKGKVNKYLKDICMMDQGYVKDEKQTVTQVLAETGKKVGATLAVTEYVYFRVGE
ncbi:MAG: translation elongation factor Ts [Spirochaetaceae bacterium]|jgi:elongation factor Ts|nr:translation elongation factor Ts [Spirochaetaceae bacterium]